MAKKNPHIGSSFESWLENAGIREEVTAAAVKAVIARQLASEMKKKKRPAGMLLAPASKAANIRSTARKRRKSTRAFPTTPRMIHGP